MTSRDFCYWLQGFFELTGAGKHPEDGSLTNVQGDLIRRHLALVFKHEIDPSQGPPEHQSALNEIHGTGTPPPKPPTTSHIDGHAPGRPDLVYRC